MSTATVDQWKIVLWKWQGVQRIERNAAFAMHPCIFLWVNDYAIALS